MSDRPQIPEELKRRVLVESGHRCAIHTCKNPDVDIHHIIPWEKCREHAFNNLIALCPNCHRRAHIGEIDRKSLLMYKAQLISRSDAESSTEVTQLQNEPATRWETKKIRCEETGALKFSVEIEFPQFIDTSSDFISLNAMLAGEAHTSLVSERTAAYVSLVYPDEWWTKTGNAFASSFSISLISGSVLSIRTSIFSYGAGAAHGNHATYGKNYLLTPLRKLDLMDCFEEPSSALKSLSDYCISYLERENHDKEPNEWVRRGAGPSWKNFNSFYLTPDELIIVFQPYEVGCYADGEREVPLGPRFLVHLLAKTSPLRSLWGLV